jgi:hypothetical protein
MPDLSITNVVNVSVATPPVGLADYDINNIAIFTKETPVDSSDVFDYRAYLSPTDVAADWGTNSEAYRMAVAIFSQTPNILTGDGQLLIFPQGSSQTLEDAIIAGREKAFFGGILYAGYAPDNTELEDAAALASTLKKMIFISQTLASSLESGGLIYSLTQQGFKYARCLLYTLGVTEARLFAAAYAGRLMSTDFEGSNTTGTMQMKDLVGIPVDTGITQTIANTCEEVGADFYASIAGLAKVFSTGGNDYSDNVYNLMWLVFALEVAGFNAIATSGTKIPQTEPGMAVLKGAYENVLTQGVRNGFIAPGSWNSPDLFGNPEDLKSNVLEQGWYIYSQPIVQQSQAQREEREAPLVQIAVKYAGAIHKSNVVVFVNR